MPIVMNPARIASSEIRHQNLSTLLLVLFGDYLSSSCLVVCKGVVYETIFTYTASEAYYNIAG